MEIQPTDKTPAVRFNSEEGSLRIEGCSIHENADGFFAPIFEKIDAYAKQPQANTTVRIEMVYFNTSSAKYLLDILKQFEEMHLSGSTQVQVEWCFEEDDLDMEEAGEDYQTLLEVPVKLLPKPA